MIGLVFYDPLEEIGTGVFLVDPVEEVVYIEPLIAEEWFGLGRNYFGLVFWLACQIRGQARESSRGGGFATDLGAGAGRCGRHVRWCYVVDFDIIFPVFGSEAVTSRQGCLRVLVYALTPLGRKSRAV